MHSLRTRILVSAVGLIAVASPAVDAACVGDCDGADGVMINEVVKTVSIFLGTDTLATCPNADRNGDGLVTIDEVVATVNSFLSDPLTCPMVTPAVNDPTATLTIGATDTPTPTQTVAATPTATLTMVTATATATLVPTATPTSTATPSATASATAPATPTFTATATPAATPTPHPAVCGNGILEDGETCAKCAADCKIKACTPTSTLATFDVLFAPPLGENASSVTALVGYRSNVVGLPGKGTGSCKGGSNDGKACSSGADCPNGVCQQPRARIKNTQSGSIVGVNDLDYAVRVVVTRSSPTAPGRIFSADFDTCQGAAAPTAADFGCAVSGCASSFGPIDGCTCTVVTP